jgi:hypothetical protein
MHAISEVARSPEVGPHQENDSGAHYVYAAYAISAYLNYLRNKLKEKNGALAPGSPADAVLVPWGGLTFRPRKQPGC